MFRRIFLVLGMNVGNVFKLLSVLRNIVMDFNNVMLYKNFDVVID